MKELKQILKERMEKKVKKAEEIFKNLKEEAKDRTVLSDNDLKLLAYNKVGFTQNEIIRLYVKNVDQLDLKARRQVAAAIQAQRASHAIKVFLM